MGQDAGLAPVSGPATTATPAPGSLDLGALARRSSVSVLGSGFAAVTNVVLVVAVTRGIDQRSAGLFFTATSLFLLLEVACRLGTTTGLVYFIPRFRVTGQTRSLGPLLRVALWPVLLASVAVGAVFAVAAPAIAEGLGGGGDGELVTALRVLAVFLPVAAVYDAVTAATRGYQDMTPTVLVERIGRPLAQLALVVGAVLAGSTALLVPAWSVPYLAALVAAGWSLHRLRRSHRALSAQDGPAATAGEVAGPFWRYTGPRILANVAQIALQRLDIVLVGVLRGPTEAAIYAAATRFLVVGQLGSQAVSLVVQPTLAELLATRDIAATRTLYQLSTAWLISLTWPLYLLSAVLAPQLVLLFGRGYDTGADVIVILALAMLVATGCGMVDMLLTMAGKTSWNLGNILLALAVNIGLNLLLIPDHGVVGAAVAWAVAITLNNLLPLVQVGGLLRIHPLGRQALTVMVAAVGCFGVLPLAARLVAGPGPLLVAAVVVGAAAYLAVLLRSRRALQLDQLVRPRRRRRAASG